MVVFLALSLVTSRALAIGLIYVLVWEGVLAGLFEGTRTFEHPPVRASGSPTRSPAGGRAAAGDVLAGRLAVIFAVSGLRRWRWPIAVQRLQTYEVGEAD